MNKKKPYLQYLLFVLVCIVFYVIFKNSITQIWEEVLNTNISIIMAISISSILYHMIEGRITYLLARRHASDYTYMKGLKNSFYASFYRVITMGSAGGISAIYNLHLDGVPLGEGIGLYFVGYVIHKIAILLYGIVILVFRKGWIRQYFSEYNTYLVLGYLLGILTVIVLILVCVSPWIYSILHFLMGKTAARFQKLTKRIEEIDQKLLLLQKEARSLLTNKQLLFRLLIDNFIKLSTYFVIPYLILSKTRSMTLIDSLSIVSITYILAATIPTPSGVGSIEAVYLLLVVKFVPQVQTAASMLLFRFATLLVPGLIGGMYIMGRNITVTHKEKHFSHE